MAALTINTYHGNYNRTKRAGGLSAIKYFNVHYTGGTGSAKNNCIYFSNGNRNASADLFIDHDGTIWEYNNILDGYYTWAVGDGRGKYGITNTNSINVEVVNNGGAFTDAQIKALAALYAHYCNILGRKLTIARHYDASRKQCPAYYVDNGRWEALKTAIAGGNVQQVTTTAPAQKPASKPVTSGNDWVRRLQTECNAQGFSKQTVDGIAGKNTLAGSPTVRQGARGGITRLLQERLNAWGYNCGTVDGIFGRNTANAVRAFQRAKGLSVDGIVGQNTWRKLLCL